MCQSHLVHTLYFCSLLNKDKIFISMRKLLLAFVMLVAFATTINAQQGELHHRVKAGYAASLVKAKVDGVKMDYDIKSSYYVGYMSEYQFNNNMAIQTGLMFSPLGAKHTKKVNDKEITTNMGFGTLSLPLSFKYYIVDGLSVNAGVNFGFNLFKKYKTEGVDDNKVRDLKDIKTFNSAGLLGLEYTLNNGLFFDVS